MSTATADRHMEQVTANFRGSVRRETLNGREYLVAPLSMITEGVLNGSKGALFYPRSEFSKDPAAWNNIPIVVYHPEENGQPVSARHPSILEKQGIGYVFNATVKGKLRAEGWFDIEKTNRVDKRILINLQQRRPMELSTGLFTDNEPKKGVFNGRNYDFIARHYRPDHLAILPDKKGACSIEDGCGVNVNENCGIGAGGFQPGNKCAAEGGGGSSGGSGRKSKLGDVDLADTLDFAQAYDKLGAAVQDQFLDLMDGDTDNLNSNAVRMMADSLRGYHSEIDDAIARFQGKESRDPEGSLEDAPVNRLITFAREYSKMGWAVQKQFHDLMDGRGEEINPNAVDVMRRHLVGYHDDITTEIDGYGSDNTNNEQTMKKSLWTKLGEMLGITTNDCGTGAGGFQPGNTCAAADGSGGGGGGGKGGKGPRFKMNNGIEVSRAPLKPETGGGGGGSLKQTALAKLMKKSTNNEDGHSGSSETFEGETDMAEKKLTDNERKELVTALVANCSCQDEKKETEEKLNKLSDGTLKELAENALPPQLMKKSKKKPMEEGEEEVACNEEEEVVANDAKPLTTKEWLKTAPPEVRLIVVNQLKRDRKVKARLIEQIVANDRNTFSKEMLEGMSTEQLEPIAALAGPTKNDDELDELFRPHYAGAAAPLGNQLSEKDSEEDILPLPVANWAEWNKEDRKKA